MPEYDDYRVVLGFGDDARDALDDLESEVRSAIDGAWKVQGGVSLVSTCRENGSVYWTAAQAMQR